MIEGSKQQQLTFEKGITNVPSDLLCSDNALEESVGMIYDNGEHRVIQKPVLSDILIENGGKILFVHRFYTHIRYIYSKLMYQTDTSYYELKWSDGNDRNVHHTIITGLKGDNILVAAIGKILIIRDDQSLHYALWKGGSYVVYNEIPEPKVTFELAESVPLCESRGSCDGMIAISNDEHYRPAKDQGEALVNLVIGLYEKNKKQISKSKRFCLPFFVRTALKLFDGSYTHISNPILLFPSVRENTFIQFESDKEMIMKTFCCRLSFENKSFTDNPESLFRPDLFDDWKDIVKEIVVFISKGIEIYDTNLTTLTNISYIRPNNVIADGVYIAANTQEHGGITTTGSMVYPTYTTQICSDGFYSALPRKEQEQIKQEIASTAIFYEAFSIGLNDLNGSAYSAEFDFSDLTSHHALEYDDYFSRSKIQSEMIFAYNSRLNISGVRRGFFEGFDYFSCYSLPEENIYRFYVTIKTEDDGEILLYHRSVNSNLQGLYFYYPDSRAKHVEIYKNGTRILDADLIEHPNLNGAYYFHKLPNGSDEPTATPAQHPDNDNNNATEFLSDYIISSEQDNPFLFKAEGYFKVGFGGIIGVSTITQALSQGQFGQFPLVIFSGSGIWAMELNNTGLFVKASPMSREVCNNAKSIIQTDDAIFFSSEKGLMVIVGKDVRCVSEQLSGRNADFTGEVSMGNFRDYLKNCFIAYDYRDSLLWIFNNSRTENNKFCYVYSIKSGTFGKFEFVAPITNVVNNYPDYLLQTGNRVYSLTERVNINLDSDEYDGLIITRPMKLENGLALKSLMQVRHIKQMQGNMTLRIFASNNTEHWVELHSLRGTPWKYYRFRYDFTNLVATDRFAGSVVITKERRTDKLL